MFKLLSYFLIGVLSFSVSFAADLFSQEQKAAIDVIVKNYIKDHPDDIYAALLVARDKEENQKLITAEKYLLANVQHVNELIRPYTDKVKDAKFTIIELFDYQCGHCQAMYKDIVNFASGKYSVAYLPLPILGKNSASAVSLSLSVPDDKFIEVNSAIMKLEKITEAGLEKIRNHFKIKTLSEEKLKAKLEKSFSLASNLGIQGVPAIIVTNGQDFKVFFGRVDVDSLQKAIDVLSSSGK